MSLKVATFNVENLFSRPKAMDLPTWSEGQPHLDAAAELNALFNKEQYTVANKTRMLKLLKQEGLLSTRPNGEYLVLRKIRGRLFTVPQSGQPKIVAEGRDDWIGWVELKTKAITAVAIENTAQVIEEVRPDILVTVEVESRPALQKFIDQAVEPLLDASFTYNMVIDGNDDRGIDVGIVSRFPFSRFNSHITDAVDQKRVFSRDCPEYYIQVSDSVEIVILPNHFASKGSDLSGKRRRVQAQRVKEIYEEIVAHHEYVIVAGDLNDYPAGGSLNALLQETDLVDAMSLSEYQGLPGTYKLANAKEKIDYLLLSPALVSKVLNVDVNRRGYFSTKWPHFENLNDPKTRELHQASDHHCLWVELDL